MDESSSNHGGLSSLAFDLPACINKWNLTLLKAFTRTSQKYCATLQLTSRSIIVIDIPHQTKVRLEGEKRRFAVSRKVLKMRPFTLATSCPGLQSHYFCLATVPVTPFARVISIGKRV